MVVAGNGGRVTGNGGGGNSGTESGGSGGMGVMDCYHGMIGERKK